MFQIDHGRHILNPYVQNIYCSRKHKGRDVTGSEGCLILPVFLDFPWRILLYLTSVWIYLVIQLIFSGTQKIRSYHISVVRHDADTSWIPDASELICGGQSGIWTRFSPITSVFHCQYHSTNAPYLLIYLPTTLCDFSNWQCL